MRSDRMYALDLARFISMLIMVQAHILDSLLPEAVLRSGAIHWELWYWVRGCTAPVFLIVSGMAHVFAAKRGEDGKIRQDVLQRRIRMGITIMGIGYFMVFPGRRFLDLPYVSAESWHNTLIVNILQLIGATLIVFVLVMESTTSIVQMRRRALIAACIILGLSPIMHYTNLHSALPSWLSPYLTMKHGAIFPFFPIASYMFVGVFTGTFIIAMPDEEKYAWLRRLGFRYALPSAIVLMLIHQYLLSIGISWTYVSSPDSEFIVLERIAIAFLFIAICTILLRYAWRYRELCLLYGRKGLHIYVTHLVLLYGTPWWDGIGRTKSKSFDVLPAMGVLALILSSTLLIVFGIDRYEKAAISKQTRSRVRKAIIWTLFIQLMLGL
ncbi:MAG: DUF1624 domain-containing protein [Ignavibacteria bacterium]|nr:DUF1624 domain-containing protein [Ignavibacteria bacterium]